MLRVENDLLLFSSKLFVVLEDTAFQIRVDRL